MGQNLPPAPQQKVQAAARPSARSSFSGGAGGVDIGALAGQLVGGGATGAIVTAIVGAITKFHQKRGLIHYCNTLRDTSCGDECRERDRDREMPLLAQLERIALP
jgi:hypothetical protein